MNFFQSLSNEVDNLENTSRLCIPKNNYYVLSISIKLEDNVNRDALIEDIEVFSKNLLMNSENRPLAVYVCGTDVHLIFTSVEENQEHYLHGDHQLLCSKYVLLYYKPEYSDIIVRIVHFSRQTELFTFLSLKNYNYTASVKCSMCPSLSVSDVKSKTEREIQDILNDNNIDWDAVSSRIKYGTLYRLRRKDKKIFACRLSEAFHANNIDRYISFIFTS